MSIQTMTEAMRKIVQAHDAARAAEQAGDAATAKVLRDYRSAALTSFQAGMALRLY